MKKEKIVFLISTVMMVVASITTVFAANYLYNSNEVSYDNTTSQLESDNVQGAIDELYEHATDYTSLSSRVDTLEGYFLNNPTVRFDSGWLIARQHASSDNYGVVIKDINENERGAFYYSVGTAQTRLGARAVGGATGSGPLNILGTPVMINDFDAVSLKNFYSSNNVITNCNTATENGYRFIYKGDQTGSNCPTDNAWYIVWNVSYSSAQAAAQRATIQFAATWGKNPVIWVRGSDNNAAWGTWKKVSLTT